MNPSLWKNVRIEVRDIKLSGKKRIKRVQYRIGVRRV
jgi:hypothetical protein